MAENKVRHSKMVENKMRQIVVEKLVLNPPFALVRLASKAWAETVSEVK